MANIPRMSRVQRRLLIREGKNSGDVATAARFIAVAHLAAGRSTVEAAEALGIARSTVVRTAARFMEAGRAGLYDRRRNNGRPKVVPMLRRRVITLLRGSPQDVGWSRPTWTREVLCHQLAHEGWPMLSVCTMGRLLASIGARLGSPKPIVLCPWPRDARERRLKQIRRLEAGATAQEPVLYADEVDIHLNPKIGRDWMLRGKQRRVVTPGKNEKFYLAGALDVRTGRLHTTGADRKGSALFCDLLLLLAARYPRAERIHLIVDNYGIHSSKATARALKALAGRIVLHFLPPYCPDANRIERVWQDLHANVTRNHRCKTMVALLDHARAFLEGYVWRRAIGSRRVALAA